MPHTRRTGRPAAMEPGHAPAATGREHAQARRRHIAAPAAWVFLLDAGCLDGLCWCWMHGRWMACRSSGRFRTFDECVADAREHGFDFDQPYHVTAGCP